MSSGMWFVVSVPKKEYEEKSNDEASDSRSIDTSPPNDQDNGEVELPPVHVEEPTPDENQGTHQTLGPKSSLYSNIYFVDKKGPLEEMLRDVLPLLGIADAVWASHENDRFYQVYFPCESADRCDHILRALSARGIGIIGQSTVAVLPCAVFYQDKELTDQESEESEASETNEKDGSEGIKLQSTKSKSKLAKGFKSMQKQFLKSVTARLTVAQVVESVKAGSEITFDFVMLVILASFIAAFGLMENSSVVIVASMLISPLMGPILAGTFGAAVRDKSLVVLGVKAELLGLMLCLIIGFVVGIACCEEYGNSPFPTTEMFGRGQLRSLWVGVLIAVPSGAGVALSVLGGNAGSLVGVAISASLLPPAVNAGLLWGISFLKHVKSYWFEEEWVHIGNEDYSINKALILPSGHIPQYSLKMDVECSLLGLMSLLLTIINIVCIIISAMMVLKIKEVAPRTNVKRTSRFWTQDIKIARDYNKTISGQDSVKLSQSFLKEWVSLNGMNPNEILRDTKTQYATLQDILRDAEEDVVYRSILTYVPRTQDHLSRRMTLDVLSNRRDYLPSGDVENGYKSSFRRVFSRRNKAKPSSDIGEEVNDPELDDVDLRRKSEPVSGTIRISDTLRKSLRSSTGTTPGSLWPPQNTLRNTQFNRFLVTPIDDPAKGFVPPLPPRYYETKD